jgi:hypothetical protein
MAGVVKLTNKDLKVIAERIEKWLASWKSEIALFRWSFGVD